MMRFITLLLLLAVARLQPAYADERIDFDDLPQAVGKDWLSMHEWSFTPTKTWSHFGPDKIAYAHVGNAEQGLLIYGETQLWGFWDSGMAQWMRTDLGNIAAVTSIPGQQTLLTVRVWGDPHETQAVVIDAFGLVVRQFSISGFCELAYESGNVIAFCEDGLLSAYDLAGSAQWQVETGCSYRQDGRKHLAVNVGGTLLVVGKQGEAGQRQNHLIAYSLAGQELWRQPTAQTWEPAILLAAGNILVDHYWYNSYVSRQMTVDWQKKYPKADNNLFGEAPDANSLVVFSAAGERKWDFSTDLGNVLWPGVLKGGGAMLLPSAYVDLMGSWYSGTALAFDAHGAKLWQVPVTGRGNAFARQCADGRLYVVSRSYIGMRDPEGKPAQAQLHRLWQDGKWEDLYTFPPGYTPVAIDTRADDYPGTGQLAVMLEAEGEARPNTYGVITFQVWDATLRQ